MNEATVGTLAAHYCAILREWIAPENLARIYAGEAHPDDFVDGNMAIAEGVERGGADPDDVDVRNAVYFYARARRFKC